MAALIACDIHPLNNLRVLKALKQPTSPPASPRSKPGSRAGSAKASPRSRVLIGRHGGAFAYGDTPTLADCYLVPATRQCRTFQGRPRAFPADLLRR
jgi:maleylpyruvate isomerase